ncbi:MAG: hypothetical protein F4Z68_05030, partial [Nitrospira sp. SB0667_bin_9]|nr:hypothetical protein [Nitrospira sp. SB0667_bin_9]
MIDSAQAKPSQAKPSQAKPSQAKPNAMNPRRFMRGWRPTAFLRSAFSAHDSEPSAARRLRRGLLAALLCLPLLAPFAPYAAAQTATTFVSNLGQTIATGVTAQLNQDSAQAFTTGGHATGYKLTSVELEFDTILQAGTHSTFTVAIHEDSSGSPGTLVGTLTVPSISTGSDQTISFAASGDGLDLAANTKYWFVFDVTAAETLSAAEDITLTASDSEDAGAASGWSIGNNSLYRNWNSNSWSSDNDYNIQIQVNGTANPAATLSIAAPADAAEGNSGTRDLTFTVSLSEPVSSAVAYQVCLSGTATADLTGAATIPAAADYQPRFVDSSNNPSNSACITGGAVQAGQGTSKHVGIRIKGD